MQQAPDGRYLVICQGERNWFEAPDTPFVIQRVLCSTEQGHLVSAELHFAGDYHEPLDPESLEHKFYCSGIGLVLTIDVITGVREELVSKTP